MLTASAALLAGCAVSPTLQQRYVGTLRGCGPAQTATLTRIHDEFAFTPGNGPLVIRGTIAPDGRLRGQLNTQPHARAPYLLTVSGRLADGTVTLRYVTPTCAGDGRLRHVAASLLP